jgi:ABC-type oligopeptide transport system substrate-binding subunit
VKIVDKTGTTKPHEITRNKPRFLFVFFCAFLWLLASLTFFGCADLQKPEIKQFYGEIKPPAKKEFRWANGKLPRQLDPALASAPPETDLVRAVYEGLTDLDPKTLEATPAIAESWEVSADGRTWTFHLRTGAKWSNGRAVTARDFKRSWRRLAEMGADVPNSRLLKNIVGAENFSIDDGITVLPDEEFEAAKPEGMPSPALQEAAPDKNGELQTEKATADTPAISVPSAVSAAPQAEIAPKKTPVKSSSVNKWLGVEAVDDQTLRVWLIQPDGNFPAAAANPLFRPVYEDDTGLHAIANAPSAITNGAFRIAAVGKDQVELNRSDIFWANENVSLDKVFMIAKPDAESALAAYQANEIDAITNTHFEPLALKLLAPYRDFRHSTHNALTFYEFNTGRKPFDDLRVRKALSMIIDRARIVQDELEGAGEPAFDYLPFIGDENEKLTEDALEAKRLLKEAGFSDTAPFPAIRLLINRNDLQRRIAQSVAGMWLKHFGIPTQIIIKDRAEYEEAIKNGDYDIVRRGVVMPTNDETTGMLTLFTANHGHFEAALNNWQDERDKELLKRLEEFNNRSNATLSTPTPASNPLERPGAETESLQSARQNDPGAAKIFLTEKEAIEQIPAIPLYFAVSNSLIKPYIGGFDTNLLDAPSLKTVVIDDKWKNSPTQK